MVENQHFSTKMNAIDAEKREESKNKIKNTKKHPKTQKNTQKHQNPKRKIKTVKQKKTPPGGGLRCTNIFSFNRMFLCALCASGPSGGASGAVGF